MSDTYHTGSSYLKGATIGSAHTRSPNHNYKLITYCLHIDMIVIAYPIPNQFLNISKQN